MSDVERIKSDSQETVRLVPVSWHNGAWHGDGTLTYTPPKGWRVKDVKDYQPVGGNRNRALIILEPSS